MNISARNVLEGTVKEVKKGTTTSHVLIDVKGLTITAQIFRRHGCRCVTIEVNTDSLQCQCSMRVAEWAVTLV